MLTAAAILIELAGCGKRTDNRVQSTKSCTTETANPILSAQVLQKPKDWPLTEFQVYLLDLAFEAATLIPVPPFAKDRSLAQEKVVETCLQLHQPVRAIRYADQIGDWRRGLCYAKTAFYLAGQGYGAEYVQPGLDLAEQIARVDHGQQWRNDRIRAKIAQTDLLLGKIEQAEQIGRQIEDSEAAVLMQTRIQAEAGDLFDEQIKQLDALVALLNFDITQSALHAYAGLFDRYYDNPQRRALTEERIKVAWGKLPIPIRLEVLKKLAQSALDHGDSDKAIDLLRQADEYLNPCLWPLENYLPLSAEWIEIQYKAGNVEQARTNADALRSMVDQKGEGIIDIYRARAIIPLARAYHTIGDPETALTIYKQAVEAGMVNPNKRPRAEDLSSICCSMAQDGIQPDAELWARMQQILKELGSE